MTKSAHIFLKQLLFSTLLVAGFLFYTPQVFAADPSLTITSSPATLYQGQSFTVFVELNSDGNEHSSSSVFLNYDPALVQAESINQGSLYPNFFNPVINNTTGQLSFQADFFGGSTTASGQVAAINFTAISDGVANLVFDVSTQILTSSSTAFPASVFTPSSVTINAPLSNATLTLSSLYSDWAVGDQQEVIVNIDSQGNNLAGVDIVLNYDPTIFTLNSTNWKGLIANQQGFSNDAVNGVVTISGVADQSNPFNGSGEVVGFVFQATSATTGLFNFDWTAGSTTDTNIVAVSSPNADLLTVNPGSLSITGINSATLSFVFNLANFLGDITTKSGSIKVMGPNTVASFSNPSALGEVLNLPLGTFTYGLSYDLVLRVPSYLAVKQNQSILAGANPLAGNLNFGTLLPGDVNQDDVNNTFDLFQLFNNWNATNLNNSADLNGDQKVNSFDVGLLYANFNQVANL